MPVTLSATLDDSKASQGFRKLANEAKAAGGEISDASQKVNQSLNRNFDGSRKKVNEFGNDTVQQMNLALNAIGSLDEAVAIFSGKTLQELFKSTSRIEQQAPNLLHFMQSFAGYASKNFLPIAAAATFATSLYSIATNLSKTTKETVASDSALASFIRTMEKYNATRKLMNVISGQWPTGKGGMADEIEKEERDLKATASMKVVDVPKITIQQTLLDIEKERALIADQERIAKLATFKEAHAALAEEEENFHRLLLQKGLLHDISEEEATTHKRRMAELAERKKAIVEHQFGQLRNVELAAKEADEMADLLFDLQDYVNHYDEAGKRIEKIKDLYDRMKKSGELNERTQTELLNKITALEGKRAELKAQWRAKERQDEIELQEWRVQEAQKNLDMQKQLHDDKIAKIVDLATAEKQAKLAAAGGGGNGGNAGGGGKANPWGGMGAGGYQFAPTMQQFQRNQQGQGLRGAFGGGGGMPDVGGAAGGNQNELIAQLQQGAGDQKKMQALAHRMAHDAMKMNINAINAAFENEVANLGPFDDEGEKNKRIRQLERERNQKRRAAVGNAAVDEREAMAGIQRGALEAIGDNAQMQGKINAEQNEIVKKVAAKVLDKEASDQVILAQLAQINARLGIGKNNRRVQDQLRQQR